MGDVCIQETLWGDFRTKEISSCLPGQSAERSKGEDYVQAFLQRHTTRAMDSRKTATWLGHQIGQTHKWCSVIFNVLFTSPEKIPIAYSRATMARFNYTVREHCPCLSFCFAGHLISCGRFSHPGLKHAMHFCDSDLAPKVTDFLNTEVLNSEVNKRTINRVFHTVFLCPQHK